MSKKTLFNQVCDHIAAEIESGTIPEGGRIPSMRELCEKFQVSHLTVLRAYRELQEKKLIVKQGKWYIASLLKSSGIKHCSGVICSLLRPMLPTTLKDNYTNDINSGLYQEFLHNGLGIFSPPETVPLCATGMWWQSTEKVIPVLRESALKAADFCDGFIFDPKIPDDTIGFILSRTGKPGVLIDRKSDLDIDCVTPDNTGAVTLACETAFRYGYRKFLFIQNSKASWNSSRRDEAFLEFARKRLSPENWSIAADWTELVKEKMLPGLHKAVDKMKQTPEPFAVIVSYDPFARHLIRLLEEYGTYLKKDYGLCGIGGDIITISNEPFLTSVRINPAELGTLAAKQLISRLSNQGGAFQLLSPAPALFMGNTL